MPTQSKRLVSGHTVRVRGVGPFAFSHLTRRFPPFEIPVRHILLETGDVVEWPYEPPDDPPPKEDLGEYELYARYQNYLYKESLRREHVERLRVEFFKIHCIDFPLSFRLPLLAWIVTIHKWIVRRFSGAVTRIPLHDRYMTFLDTEVIQSVDAWRWIQEAAIIEEVTLDGILDAARQFRGAMGGQTAHTSTSDGSVAEGQESVQHDGVGSSGGASGGIERG